MKKTLYLILLLVSALACHSLPLGEHLVSSTEDTDYTLQEIPNSGLTGKKLCLWKGDTFLGYFNNVFEESETSQHLYGKIFINTLRAKAEPGHSINFRDDFTASPQMDSIEARYKMGQADVLQLIYILKDSSGIHVAIFTFIDQSNVQEVKARVDGIMKNVTIKEV